MHRDLWYWSILMIVHRWSSAYQNMHFLLKSHVSSSKWCQWQISNHDVTELTIGVEFEPNDEDIAEYLKGGFQLMFGPVLEGIEYYLMTGKQVEKQSKCVAINCLSRSPDSLLPVSSISQELIYWWFILYRNNVRFMKDFLYSILLYQPGISFAPAFNDQKA